MKKIKQIELLRKKEKVNRNLTASRLGLINSDAEKCSKISNELEQLARDAQSDQQKLNSRLYINGRFLIHKVMDQKEVLTNRMEFLENEKRLILEELNKSKFKDEIYKKRKVKLDLELQNEKELKAETSINSLKRS